MIGTRRIYTCLTWLAALIVIVTGRRQKRSYSALSWSDCGGADKILHLSSLHISPMPVVLPGVMRISFDANSTETISEAALHLSIQQETFFGYYVEIPCLFNIGSCNYDDMCTVLQQMTSEDWLGIAADIARQIRGLLQNAGIGYSCPVEATAMNVREYPFQMPELPALLAAFSDGNYKVQFEIVKPSTGRQLGCFNINLSMKRPERHGWFSRRRR